MTHLPRARRLVAAAALAVLSSVMIQAAPARVQAPQAVPSGDRLVVTGDVKETLTITLADLKSMPRKTVTIAEEGRQVPYEGVLVAELLRRAGVPLGRDLMGKALTTYVRATAKDGYDVVFSLGELDPAQAPNDIIVADTVDGKPLFDYQGPFRLVAPHDTRGARGVRMLQRLEVVRLAK